MDRLRVRENVNSFLGEQNYAKPEVQITAAFGPIAFIAATAADVKYPILDRIYGDMYKASRSHVYIIVIDLRSKAE